MIRKIDYIQNLGVFSDFKWPKSLNEFERFNLIYGLNGSGKTTLSRFFDDLSNAKSAGFPDLKYKVSEDGAAYKTGDNFPRNIRVFNSEYVRNNIGELEGELNPIFIIGEENKSLADQVRKDEADRLILVEEISRLLAEEGSKQKLRNKKFTEAAREIGDTATGASKRTYRKPDAEKAFENIQSTASVSSDDFAAAISAIKQQPRPLVSEISLQLQSRTSGSLPEEFGESLKRLEGEIRGLVEMSANSNAIEKLTLNKELSSWVESGLSLHTENEQKVCQFCLQPIPTARWSDLVEHFNQSDLELKFSIVETMALVDELLENATNMEIAKSTELYSDFRADYQESLAELEKHKFALLEHLKMLRKVLGEKLTRRTESYSREFGSFQTEVLGESVDSANRIVRACNKDTSDFEARQNKLWDTIQNSVLHRIRDDIQELDAELASIRSQLNTCRNGDLEQSKIGLDDLTERISENRLRIANAHQAAEALTSNLKVFLGRSELKFRAEGEGYRIERAGRPATNLSEGEKTAITFLYFVVGLKDQDFDIDEGVVVIDDPISSLDSSSVYQAFSFLKNSVQDSHQIFLFTHNFDFLKLLITWFQRIPKREGKKSYYMLQSDLDDARVRQTRLTPLDRVLLENKNEFAYLYKILRSFTSDGTIQNSYHIPNVARKVLEVFLDQHSHGNGLYQKLENLEFDEQKKTALYKFSNDLSHPTLSGIDPSLVGETQKNVRHVIEMIREVAPAHHSALEKLIRSDLENQATA